MQGEQFYGQRHKHKGKFLMVCLYVLGMMLNQSSVLLGINFSLADLLLLVVVINLSLSRMLFFPLKPSVFLLVLSALILFTSFFLVPVRFPFNPDPRQIFSDYVKLLAVFMYFVVGYNLARMNLAENVLKGFSSLGVVIGLLAFVSVVSRQYFGFRVYVTMPDMMIR